MNKSMKNAFETVVYSVMPFVATALLVLMQFVIPGVDLHPDRHFWVDFGISAIALLFYYFPFKNMFKRKYRGTERMINKEAEYMESVSKIYDGNLKKFSEFCDEEWKERQERYAKQCLQLFSGMTATEFIEKYKMSVRLVRKDMELSRRQKAMAVELIVKYRYIKKVNYEKVLRSVSESTVFNRLKTNADKSEKFLTMRKIVNAMLITFATVSITISVNFELDAVAIVTQLTIRLAAGLWQIFAALLTANRLVNKLQFQELAEKTLFMSEFFEAKAIKIVS